MLRTRTLAYLFASVLTVSNASAQMVHTTIISHKSDSPQLSEVKQLGSVPDTAVIALSTTSDITTVSSSPHAGLVVTNVWPNPLHPASSLHLELLTDKDGPITAGIYDVAGTQKGTLDLGQVSVGSNELQAPVPDLTSGEYLIRIQQGTDNPVIVKINYIK
jgi:hypothetical protein